VPAPPEVPALPVLPAVPDVPPAPGEGVLSLVAQPTRATAAQRLTMRRIGLGKARPLPR